MTGYDLLSFDHDTDRRATERFRTDKPHFRIFIRKHDRRVTDLNLSMSNFPFVSHAK